MKLRAQFTVRAFAAYAAALAGAWILTEAVWGAAGGVVGGLSVARNPQYRQMITALVQETGDNSGGAGSAAREEHESLSPGDSQELTRIIRETLTETNWFPLTLFVSAIVFGLVGFLGGLAARAWLLAGVVPALSFLTNNPLVRFGAAEALPVEQKLVVAVFAQFAICYLLAFRGARLGLSRMQRKVTSKQAAEPTV